MNNFKVSLEVAREIFKERSFGDYLKRFLICCLEAKENLSLQEKKNYIDTANIAKLTKVGNRILKVCVALKLSKIIEKLQKIWY